jgi:predicted transcriptional regulator
MNNLKALDSNFLTGMLNCFFDEEINFSKTDLKVFFTMYQYSNEIDYFEFNKYSDVEHLIGVDKHQFSKSIKKLIKAEFVIKNHNSFKLLSQPPF